MTSGTRERPWQQQHIKNQGARVEITVTDTKTGGQPEVALNPAGWLAGILGALGDVATTTLELPDLDAPYDPLSDEAFTIVTRVKIGEPWPAGVAWPLETYGLSTACSGAALARASGGVPVRGCSPSPLSSSIRQGFLKP